jgi:pyruvate formate-lyase activating enzyme-like uncharacterized protein
VLSIYNHKKILIERNKKEYGEKYQLLNWISSERIASAMQERDQILVKLARCASFGFKDTKVDVSSLSPGCRICGEGTWSCLFINAQCNCHCFYCPSPQDQIDLPTTNTVTFDDPYFYAEYIDSFRFKGASISGGEPLLTLNRTLKYLSVLKQRFGTDLHTWLYTNGTLSNREVLHQLRDTGLDEIRFDIGATSYELKKVREAVGIIPVVTVEIPAIPEDEKLMQTKMKELADAGINHLNLHQLRLTPHNFNNLINRGYTFLHGAKVTVLESELIALRLIQYGYENNIELPLNYCSFVYKNQFQKSAARRRNAVHVIKPYESITENGHIRDLYISDSDKISKNMQDKLKTESDSGLHIDSANKLLHLHPDHWDRIKVEKGKIFVRYYEAKILEKITYHHPYTKINVDGVNELFVEKHPVGEAIELNWNQFLALRDQYATLDIPEIAEFEKITAGLQEYF